MSGTLRRDIYSLGNPGFPIHNVKNPEPDPLATIRYSYVYWVYHLYDASRSTGNDDRFVAGRSGSCSTEEVLEKV
jgi:hypothetical protein